MGLQLIFVLEKHDGCQSDWVYIKNTIKQFYYSSLKNINIEIVYMPTREDYRTVENDVKYLMFRYRGLAKNNHSKLIYCFDCDNYKFNQKDITFLKEAKRYIDKIGADFVWLCRDVNKTYLSYRDEILKIDNLVYTKYRFFGTNLFVIMNKHLF